LRHCAFCERRRNIACGSPAANARPFGYCLSEDAELREVAATSAINRRDVSNQSLIDRMLDVYKPLDSSRGRCAMDRKIVQDSTRHFAQLCSAILGVVSIFICAIDAHAAAVEPQQALLKERVQAFVRAITRNTGFSDDESQIRWNRPICFLAAGWRPEDRSSVLTRLSEISAAVGAPLAGKACTPNFVVVLTAEPDQVINAWYAKNKQLFGNASALQIRHFLDSTRSRPVRVWRNIDIGRVATTRFGHFVPSNSHADPSPFTGNSPLEFLSAFEIIDATRTAGIDLHQLSDYVAMIGLSNIDIDVDVGDAPSILQLFSPARSIALGLSNWDSAYLTALYQTDQSSRSQRFEIAQRAAEAVTH
jgi:hypothetical protein